MLVLEVRSFPSPSCAVLAFCPSFVSAFFFQGWPGSGRVCVCTICIDVKPVLFLFSLLLVFIVIGFNGFVQGVPGIIASLALTKTLALICDIRKGRLSDVPAN